MTEAQARELRLLHEISVKAALRWQSATIGTQTARQLSERADRAEKRFTDKLNQLTRKA